MLYVDSKMGNLDSLTFARMLVRTKAQNRIDTRVKLLFDQSSCDVWVKEVGSLNECLCSAHDVKLSVERSAYHAAFENAQPLTRVSSQTPEHGPLCAQPSNQKSPSQNTVCNGAGPYLIDVPMLPQTTEQGNVAGPDLGDDPMLSQAPEQENVAGPDHENPLLSHTPEHSPLCAQPSNNRTPSQNPLCAQPSINQTPSQNTDWNVVGPNLFDDQLVSKIPKQGNAAGPHLLDVPLLSQTPVHGPLWDQPSNNITTSQDTVYNVADPELVDDPLLPHVSKFECVDDHVWIDPIVVNERLHASTDVRTPPNRSKKSKPRGRPRKDSDLPSTSGNPALPPSCSLLEAQKTWDTAKILGISANDENAALSGLRRSKRILILEGNTA